ncbi:MAG: N-methyl-D-aspartate receptor subunit [Pedosphaera sp.]|nr:N-methyl-D-aspartate receptor subunit [Pedosphaera sp.]
MPKPNSDRWFALWKRLGAQGAPALVYSDLVTHYAESHRAYHNLSHIDACLCEFDRARHLAKNGEAIEAAIWFHDIIYDTHAKDNEERSAALAQSTLKAVGLTDNFTENVFKLILATKHTSMPSGLDATLLVDVDLSILGQSQAKFDEYERQIREEYNWVDAQAFAIGRSSVLKSFLERSSIYSTDFFRSKYEAKARENIIQSLAQLQEGPKGFKP